MNILSIRHKNFERFMIFGCYNRSPFQNKNQSNYSLLKHYCL